MGRGRPAGKPRRRVKQHAQLLVRPDCVFDASLVPETWRDSFIDSTGVMSKLPGESRNRKLTHYRSFDATHARRVLSSGDAISRLDSVGKPERKPGASLPANRVALRHPHSKGIEERERHGILHTTQTYDCLASGRMRFNC